MLDRDALWAVYDRYSMPNDVQEERGLGFETFVQEVEATVRPAAIDRDALTDWIKGRDWREWKSPDEVVDGILALVRPAPAGVTLTAEQARRAAGWYFQQADDIVPDDADRALVAQLEAAS